MARNDSDLLAELSHDLRQPLTVLRMNLQCASRMLDAPSPNVAEAVQLLAECLGVERSVVALLEQAQCGTTPSRDAAWGVPGLHLLVASLLAPGAPNVE